MPDSSTALILRPELLDEAGKMYRVLGFARVEDLVATALEEYLKRRSVDEKNESMRRAAADPNYLSVIRQISEDFKYVDAENLPPDY